MAYLVVFIEVDDIREMIENTPIREQYLTIKNENPGIILFFQMGDFYETFDEDAKLTSEELGIAYTSREMGKGTNVPMAGIPCHSLENYLSKLIKNGHRVAICNQVGESTNKGLVERQVVRVVSPGTLVESSMLDIGPNNFLVSVVFEGDVVGLSYVDITTSEFATTQIGIDYLQAELGRLNPSEILIPENQTLDLQMHNCLVTLVDNYDLDHDKSEAILKEHFGVRTLEAYGCKNMPLAVSAAGIIISYINHTQKFSLSRMQSLHTYLPSDFMLLDNQSRRSLELFQSGRWGEGSNSLLSILDRTNTPMGGRLMHKWISQPLLDLEELILRQDKIEVFYKDKILKNEIISVMKDIGDTERLINRIGTGIASHREILSIKSSLESFEKIKQIAGRQTGHEWLSPNFESCQSVQELIHRSVESFENMDRGSIKKGFSKELDQLKDSSVEAKQYIAKLEKSERDITGIKSLKVGYNRVFGYYIEVSNSNLSQIPDNYTRRQTLIGAERFITSELKEYESKLLNAQESIYDLEKFLFQNVCEEIDVHRETIIRSSQVIANLDVLTSLADAASLYRYVRPELNRGRALDIKAGRHPIVEHAIQYGSFVSNDTILGNEDSNISIITGPNMAGKSTYIRQVALIVLMAQIGSFVPATSAKIGLVDRVFTRIGLHDDLSTGQSTFMLEMVETATILHHATPRSLVILDEIGRGTSTYDGLAIARATIEYIHQSPNLNCKTLFATHYHELIELSSVLKGVNNLNVAAIETNGSLVFLYSVMEGGADRSYGVNVANLAGMPGSLVLRAREILRELEEVNNKPRQKQFHMFELNNPMATILKDVDIDSMTPIEAINKLYELKNHFFDIGNNLQSD